MIGLRILSVLASCIFLAGSTACEDLIFQEVPVRLYTLYGMHPRAPSRVGVMVLTNKCNYLLRYSMEVDNKLITLGTWASRFWIWPGSYSYVKATCNNIPAGTSVTGTVSLTVNTTDGSLTRDVKVECSNHGVNFRSYYRNPMEVSSRGEHWQHNVSVYSTVDESDGVVVNNRPFGTAPLSSFDSYGAYPTPFSTCAVGGQSFFRRPAAVLEELKQWQCDALQDHPYLGDKRHCRGPTTTTSTTNVGTRYWHTEPDLTGDVECCEQLKVDIRDDNNYRRFEFKNGVETLYELVKMQFVFPMFNANGTDVVAVQSDGVVSNQPPQQGEEGVAQIPNTLYSSFWAAFWQKYDKVAEVGGVGYSSYYTIQWTDAKVSTVSSYFTYQMTLYADGNWEIRSNLCADQGDLIRNSVSGYQEMVEDNFKQSEISSTFDTAPGHDVRRTASILPMANPLDWLEGAEPESTTLEASPGSVITMTTTGADELPIMYNEPIGTLYTIDEHGHTVVMGSFPLYAEIK